MSDPNGQPYGHTHKILVPIHREDKLKIARLICMTKYG